MIVTRLDRETWMEIRDYMEGISSNFRILGNMFAQLKMLRSYVEKVLMEAQKEESFHASLRITYLILGNLIKEGIYLGNNTCSVFTTCARGRFLKFAVDFRQATMVWDDMSYFTKFNCFVCEKELDETASDKEQHKVHKQCILGMRTHSCDRCKTRAIFENNFV